MNLKGKHFLNIEDFSKDNLLEMLNLASELKNKVKNNQKTDILKKNSCHVFLKTEPQNKNQL
jgi:ornithine carbamoyltransferase